MTIALKWVWELGQASSVGTTYVITDVYAATTNIVTLLSRQVKKIIIVNDLNVQAAKHIEPDALLVGESNVLPGKEFASSNYPSALDTLSVTDRTILYMSANGSKVIEAVFEHIPVQVLTVSFCNLDAVAKVLREKTDANIILVASGNREFADQAAEEDLACLQALKKRINDPVADIGPEIRAAERAVRTHYASEDMQKDIEIVFHAPQVNVVPVCKQQDGAIIIAPL